MKDLIREGLVPDKKKYIVRESFKYIRTQMELLERELESSFEDFEEVRDNVIYGITEKIAQMERNLKKQ